jgi:putative acetyltransferase
MSLQLRTVSPAEDSQLPAFLDRAFGRPDQESRLATRLSAEHPGFDPSLSLVAERDGEPVGWGLFMPRKLRLRDTWVPLAISSPFCTLPEVRGEGVGRFLLDTGFGALRDRGIRGAVVIGAPEFFRNFGYAPAFNFCSYVVRATDLPDTPVAGWRGLVGDDLPALRELYERSYRDTPGCEQRELAALEWDVSIAGSHALAWAPEGQPKAYVRFRVREQLELRECGAVDAEALTSVLSFLRQLMAEHGRERMEAHLPPAHPVARALFHHGCLEQRSNFAGAALLRVLDWAGLIHDTRASWRRPMEQLEVPELSLEFEAEDALVHLGRASGGWAIEAGRRGGRHLFVPAGWGPGLVTGQRNYLDLLGDARVLQRSELDETGRRLLRSLFPTEAPFWSYAPVFEIADG